MPQWWSESSNTVKVIIIGCSLLILAVFIQTMNMRPASQSSQSRTSVYSSTPSPAPQTKVTRANYERLKEGMTFEQVKEILGPIEEVSYESKSKDGSAGVYRWGDEKNGYIICQFQDGKLYSPTQIGLKQ